MTPALPVTELLCGRYRIERLLGQGGMADVYLAVDEAGGPAVAVKLVRSNDPELARRLAQEAKAVARFDHPGLVRLLDAGVHDNQAFLVMELVEGPTLAARLRRGPLPPDRCAALGSALAEALAYVHGHGIVHRDVKPGNVLLGPKLQVRLADFGIAQLVDASSLTLTGTTLGTAAYMAPEQLEHHRVGTAADVWSLGAILLECMTGRRGYEGSATEVVARRMAGAMPPSDDLPTPWRILLRSMLDHDPGSRPNASEVAEILPSPAFARPWTPDETRRLLSAGPAVALAAGAAVAMAAGATVAMAGANMDATAIGDPRTQIAPVGPAMVPAHRSDPARRAMLAAAAAAVLVATAGITAWALTGNATPNHRTAGVSTTTTTTTTTTTAPVTASDAAAALTRDVQTGVATGTLSTDAGKTILNQLGQALAAAAAGDTQQTAAALGSIDGTIAGGAQSGDVTPSEASTLMADVATLALALNLPAPTTTTTAAGPGTAGGPGAGPGSPTTAAPPGHKSH
ncbi:MAG: serine/threonine-protein kinase [Acidimicrobiales bacterium]